MSHGPTYHPLAKTESRSHWQDFTSHMKRRFLESHLPCVYHRILKSPPITGNVTIPIRHRRTGTIFAGHPFLSVHFILGEQKKVNKSQIFHYRTITIAPSPGLGKGLGERL